MLRRPASSLSNPRVAGSSPAAPTSLFNKSHISFGLTAGVEMATGVQFASAASELIGRRILVDAKAEETDERAPG
jgi:hypothetical protein